MTDHRDVSTPPPIPPIASPSSQLIPADLKDVLEFISKENERHRSYFKDLFDRTAWVLGIIVLVAGGIAVYFGFNTAQGAKQIAQVQAKEAVTKQIDELKPEIQKRISVEFENDTIEQLVRREAQIATVTTANKIIRQEVDQQVKTAVANEEETIHSALKVAADGAVSRVQNTINSEAERVTQRVVAEQIRPQIQKLSTYTDVSFLLLRVRGNDAIAFDKLFVLSKDESAPSDLRAVAASNINEIVDDFPRTVSSKPCTNNNMSVDTLVEHFLGSDQSQVLDAIYCMQNPRFLFDDSNQTRPKVYLLLDKLYALMTTSPDLNVRRYSFFDFTRIVKMNEMIGPHLRAFDNDTNARWWKANRSRYIP